MAAFATPRLLVVDDQSVHRLCARVILQYAWPGCVVEEANSLRWARAFLAERQYDLMLLDLQLPDGLGLELLQEHAVPERFGRPRPQVPAVAMSSERTPDHLLACHRAGLHVLLDKPLQADQLVHAVQPWLEFPTRLPSAAEAMMQASPEISHDVSSRRSAPSAHLCHHLPPRCG
jgi:two-component system response regulator PilR (NtrC family)